MSYFSDSLKSCMQKAGVGTADLARACGLDRTQVHRYVNGTRTPVDVNAVDVLLSGLRLSVKEKEELYENYYRTAWGDYVYESNQLICDILKQMNENAEAGIGRYAEDEKFYLGKNKVVENEEIVSYVKSLRGRSEILRYMDRILLGLARKEKAELKMILQPNYSHFKSKVNSFVRNCMDITIEHIICMERKAEDEKIENLQILSAILPLFDSPADYHAYYYYNEIDEHINTMTIMPNVMIGKNAVLVFDYEMEYGMLYQEPEIVKCYHEIFTRMKTNCSEFGKRWNDTKDFMQSVDDLNVSGVVDYQLHKMPCLGKCLSRDIFENHFYEQIPNRAELIEYLCTTTGEWKNGKYYNQNIHEEGNYYSLFSKEGLIWFMENGRVLECPSELYEPLPLAVRITMVERMLLLMETNYMNYRLLKGYSDPSANLIIDVYANIDKVSFVFSEESHRMEINIFESGIVQSFRKFREFLLESDQTCTKEETVNWLKEVIAEYKKKL